MFYYIVIILPEQNTHTHHTYTHTSYIYIPTIRLNNQHLRGRFWCTWDPPIELIPQLMVSQLS